MMQIGNRIVADKAAAHVRQAAAARTSAIFADRHSVRVRRAAHTGAAAANHVLYLLITAFGRDLLTLIGLYRRDGDPGSDHVAVRRLVIAARDDRAAQADAARARDHRRCSSPAAARTVETLQETLQGLRIVKAFTLEDEMRRGSTAASRRCEHEADKWARVANRASPLMETLGGFAIGVSIVYGGYLVIHRGADARRLHVVPRRVPARLRAGQATRAAQPRARQPPGRRAHAVRDDRQLRRASRPTTTSRRSKLTTRARRVRRCALRLSARRAGAARHVVRRRARQGDGAGRPVGRRQVDRAQPDPALLRDRAAARSPSTGRTSRTVSRRSLRQQIAYVGQDVLLFRGTIRDNIALRQARRERGRDRRRRQGRARA